MIRSEMMNWGLFTNNQSIKVRFFFSLLVNIIKIGLSFVAGIIIARNLGPGGYGNYNFLLGSFISIITLFDMGTSSAFYTFLSQRKQNSKFYLYYFVWLGMQFILILVLIALIFPDIWRNKIWLGQAKSLIIIAFSASFIKNKIWQTVTQAGESIRATVTVQLHNIIYAGLYLCTIFIMYYFDYLTIYNIFIVIIFTYLLFIFLLAGKLKHNLIAGGGVEFPKIIDKFKTYCTPLIIYSIASFAYSFADVWLLQKFGGAVQQGFYSIGLRFSSICLIVTSSIMKIFWKEIAEAHELRNKERVYYLYIKISRSFYFIAAVGACFLIPFSKEILFLLLGPKYEAGWLCLAIMFIYPVHQSLGQINGTYFYATTQTKLYSRLGIIIMIVSIPVTYFVLASPSALIPGLGLASIGLALKMVILQMIGVNIFTYFICKTSKWEFNFLYQFTTIGLLLMISFTIKVILSWSLNLINISLYPLVFIILCLPIYILIIGVIIYFFPKIIGIEKEQVISFLYTFNRIFRRI